MKLFAALFVLLSSVAWLAPAPDRLTDRDVYEMTAARRIVVDCTDLHCFRVLVAWVLGALPGPSVPKWKLYAALSNAAAAVALSRLCVILGLPADAAAMAAWTSAFGFGSLYTLFDPFSSDPLMYLLGPLLTILVLRGRLIAAGWTAAVGALAKEFAGVPLFVAVLAASMNRQWALMQRTLAAANAALIVWLLLQFWLMFGYNYGYGDNPSTHLASGGYLKHWLDEIGPRGAIFSMFTEYGALWLMAPVGLFLAPGTLRRLALAAMPAALLFAYVQQPDRALWNFHYLMIPLAMLVAAALPAWAAWSLVACFAFANLRLGAQLPYVPASRLALLPSVLLAAAAIVRVFSAPVRLSTSEPLAL